jgi:hypothetical protein
MKTTTSITVVATLLYSATAQFNGYTLIAARSASPIHLREIAASGHRLYIGRPTASYCPEIVEEQDACPPGNTTTFSEGDGYLGMAVEVPGGQGIYIDPVCGAVGYTIAHSSAVPEGAIRDGWTYSPGESFGYLSWRNGLLACPTSVGADEYEIFAQVDGVQFGDDCLGFDALASNVTGVGAWQYI